MSAPVPRRPPWFLLLVLLYVCFALIAGGSDYLKSSIYPSRWPWVWQVYTNLGFWLLWALLTPLVFWLGRRFPLDRQLRPAHVLVHLAYLCVAIPLQILLELLVLELVTLPYAGRPLRDKLLENFQPWQWLVHWWLLNVLIYLVLLAIAHALHYRKESRDRALEASELRARLAAAQLQALKSQLQPHFLFNTLNAISTLIVQSPAQARTMLNLLARLLRRSLSDADVQEVPLREELEFAQCYLDIEQIRFSNRLRVELHAEPSTLGLRVPHSLLQPLLENAVRHGISPRAGHGTIRISAARQGGQLLLRVRDDGVGSAGLRRGAPGLGLANVRARLAHLYGPAADLEHGPQPDGGYQAEVRLPLRDGGGT
jgi:two-component system, LytTR family, sensor kinase